MSHISWLCLLKTLKTLIFFFAHTTNMAATSMAAALAASLPAPAAAPVPVAPTYEAIPASMSKVIDIEAEIPLTNAQIDGMVGSF